MNNPVISAACGESHTVVLHEGRWWGTGTNDCGQLGLGHTEPTSTLTAAQAPEPLISVAADGSSTVAVGESGAVYVAGRNAGGRLGVGQLSDDVLELTEVVTSRRVEPAAKVAMGERHTLLVSRSGRMFAAGDNAAGQHGKIETTFWGSFHEADVLDDVVDVAAGWGHSVAVRGDGSVWGAGQTSRGQLGDRGDGSNLGYFECLTEVDTPIVAAAAAGNHTLLVAGDGTLWAAGLDRVFPDHRSGDPADQFLRVPGISDVVAVDTSTTHTLALRSDGTVVSFGIRPRYFADHSDVGVPLEGCQGDVVPNLRARSVHAGNGFSVIVGLDSTVWVQGRPGGHLGLGPRRNASAFTPLLMSLPDEILLSYPATRGADLELVSGLAQDWNGSLTGLFESAELVNSMA